MAATNRPTLFSHLSSVVKPTQTNGRPLTLPESTTFNGYKLAAGQSPVYYITPEPAYGTV
ncbi:MAG TPA: hypothetical protein VFK47_07715 [Ktedonobacteraceae bacterium]|nr:hypothetical protein [Ktedonobacteraceae bacterium]